MFARQRLDEEPSPGHPNPQPPITSIIRRRTPLGPHSRPVYRPTVVSPEADLHGILEDKVHHTVGAYSRPMAMSLGPPYERRGTLSSSNTLQASPGVLRTIHSPTVPSRAFAVGRSYSRIRTRTAPRVILRSQGRPCRRTLGRGLSFFLSHRVHVGSGPLSSEEGTT